MLAPTWPVTAARNVVAVEREQLHRPARGDRRRARHVAQQRDLAEALARPERAHGLAVDEHLDLALVDHVVAVAGVALRDDGRRRPAPSTGRERHRQPVERRQRQHGEHRQAAQQRARALGDRRRGRRARAAPRPRAARRPAGSANTISAPSRPSSAISTGASSAPAASPAMTDGLVEPEHAAEQGLGDDALQQRDRRDVDRRVADADQEHRGERGGAAVRRAPTSSSGTPHRTSPVMTPVESRPSREQRVTTATPISAPTPGRRVEDADPALAGVELVERDHDDEHADGAGDERLQAEQHDQEQHGRGRRATTTTPCAHLVEQAARLRRRRRSASVGARAQR